MTLVKGDNHCFVCGSDNPIGLKLVLTSDRTTQSASARIKIGADYQGWNGIVHGGVIAALLDEICMHASMTLGEQMVTAELTVRYREPLPVETDVEVIGQVIGVQKRLISARGRIEREGRVLAEADAKVFRLA